jgi:hypothetical protein
MTASVGREVDANLLRGAALGSAKTRAHPQDAGGQDLGDLVEALGRGHEVGMKSVGQHADVLVRCEPAVWSASTTPRAKEELEIVASRAEVGQGSRT